MSIPHLEYRPHWTAADLEHIPSEFRAEIVHGVLVVAPSPTNYHQKLMLRLEHQLEPQLPNGWATTVDFDVIFADDHTRRPDLGVVREASFHSKPMPASEIALLVEIVSPGSEFVDRSQKPQEYAKAGIPAYWRIETRGSLAIIGYELVGDSYFEHPPATDVFTIQQPWPVSIKVPDLRRIGPR